MNLIELQRRMSEDVRRPLTFAFEMQPTTEDGRSVSEIPSHYVKPNSLLSSFERLEIYNRHYWFRVIGASRKTIRHSTLSSARNASML
jgi:hypothetical protein